MTGPIQVFAHRDSPALRFVLSFIFDTFYGCGFTLVSEKSALDVSVPTITYGKDDAGKLNITPTGYLFQDDLSQYPVIEIVQWKGLPAFFGTGEGNIPFDLFGAIFFLLSRAEEYHNKTRDHHGRFLASHSALFDSGLHSRPLVDEWLMALLPLIRNHFPGFTPQERSFQWINTLDVDVAYAYRHRGPLRWIGACAKDILNLNFSNFFRRMAVRFNGAADPFDTYPYEAELSKGYHKKYFFLLGNRSLYDKNLAHSSTGLRTLISTLASRAEIGIHPSYESNNSLVILEKEIDRLRYILGKKVGISRQHYLKLSLPHTYRNLIKAEIAVDYSMGFADRPGFRSGTCTPHFFFDLEKQETTPLKIVPLTIMEVTLQDYMGLSAKEAMPVYQSFIDQVKAVNGTFVSLWHNESLSESGKWKGWREVYTFMANLANSGARYGEKD